MPIHYYSDLYLRDRVHSWRVDCLISASVLMAFASIEVPGTNAAALVPELENATAFLLHFAAPGPDRLSAFGINGAALDSARDVLMGCLDSIDERLDPAFPGLSTTECQTLAYDRRSLLNVLDLLDELAAEPSQDQADAGTAAAP